MEDRGLVRWFDAPEPVDMADYDYRAGVRSALGLFVFLTVARLAFNFLTTGKTSPAANADAASQQEKVAEEAWLGVGTTWLVVWSWWALLTSGSACGLSNTMACIDGWPAIPSSTRVTSLFEAEIAWYVHMLTRGWLGVGFNQDTPMAVHHLVTLFLIIVGYARNIMRFGTLMLAVFNASNPFLHISKVANTMKMARARVFLFALFGVMFFLTRVVLLPATVMRCTLVETRVVLKSVPYMWWLYYFGNMLLVGLYGMQLVWMSKIVRVLTRGKTGTTPKVANGKKTPFQDGRVEGTLEGVHNVDEKNL